MPGHAAVIQKLRQKFLQLHSKRMFAVKIAYGPAVELVVGIPVVQADFGATKIVNVSADEVFQHFILVNADDASRSHVVPIYGMGCPSIRRLHLPAAIRVRRYNRTGNGGREGLGS